jgi:hypothetical protein
MPDQPQPQTQAPAIVFDLIRGEVSQMSSPAAALKVSGGNVAASGLPQPPRQ